MLGIVGRKHSFCGVAFPRLQTAGATLPFPFGLWCRQEDKTQNPSRGPHPIRRSRHLPQHFAQRRLLVVDDDETNCEVLRRILTNYGAEVVVASDGFAFMDAMRTDSFDAVCLDVMMPDLTGLEALERLQASGEPRHLPPIFVVTAHDSRENRRIGQRLGVAGFFPKPVPFPLLVNALKKDLAV